MDKTYPGHGIISRSNQKLFDAWNQEDPIDDWERERARRIEALQGNHNVFIWGEAPSDRPTTPAIVASPNGAIIGNKKSKIYHRPDCPGAAKVSQQNRVRFTTEEEAQAAGYRVAGNCPQVLYQYINVSHIRHTMTVWAPLPTVSPSLVPCR